MLRGHLKARLADGAKLSEPEWEFIGYGERANGHRNGWRSLGLALDLLRSDSVQDLRRIRYVVELGDMTEVLDV